MDLARAALACRLPWQVFECLISCTNRPKIINGPNVKRTRDPFEHVTAAQQGLFFVVCTGKEDSSGGGGEQQLPLGAGGTTAALCHVCGCPHSAAFHEVYAAGCNASAFALPYGPVHACAEGTPQACAHICLLP
eukprot:372692-Pelagomonas_calceolata.AAC.6